MVETHPLVLSLRSAGLKDIDLCKIEDVHSMWHAFSKAKHCIDGGDRFEYLSWRLYSREILCRGKSYKKTQFDKLRPEMLCSSASDANGSVEQNISDEEEWESDLEGSSIGDNESNSFSPQISRAHDSSAVDLQNSLVSYGHIHRQISSLELQNLFNDSKASLSSSSPKTASVQLKSDKIPQKTVLKKSSTASPEPHGKVFHARFRSPQFDSHSETYRDSSRSSGLMCRSIPSAVIRGFSPSNVSVSVSNKHGRNYHNPLSLVRGVPNIDDSGQIEGIGGPAEIDHSETKDKQKMFYICAADSDTESSVEGSLEKYTRQSCIQPKSPSNSLDDEYVSLEPPKKAVDKDEKETRPLSGSPAEFTEGSDWADTSDDDFENETAEDSRGEMFEERVVPTKPLLKRSLLSSLFGSKIINRFLPQPNPSSKSTQVIKVPARSHAEVSAPVDIILGAPLAPHLPFASEQNMVNNKTSEIMNINIIGGGIKEQREQEQLQNQSKSMNPGNPTPTHITGRPEIYRAATDNLAHRPSSDSAFNQSSWENHHEDIYDPMNYHSRGW